MSKAALYVYIAPAPSNSMCKLRYGANMEGSAMHRTLLTADDDRLFAKSTAIAA